MAEQDDKPAKSGLIDNAMAPDVFADEACGFFLRNGAVSITLATARVDHRTSPGPVHRVVIGRVVMTVAGAQDLAENLFDFLAKHGLTRRRVLRPPTEAARPRGQPAAARTLARSSSPFAPQPDSPAGMSGLKRS